MCLLPQLFKVGRVHWIRIDRVFLSAEHADSCGWSLLAKLSPVLNFQLLGIRVGSSC
jgi:hypothetical protein